MLKFSFHLLNVNFSNLIIVVWVQPLYIQCVHMYCKLVLCVCPLYIHLTCNVCPLYIPLTSLSPFFPLTCPSVWHSYLYVYSTGVHKTSIQYRCAQNQFTVQVYTKPVYSTGVNKNKVTVQVYTKLAYSTGVHKSSLYYSCTQKQIREHCLNSVL